MQKKREWSAVCREKEALHDLLVADRAFQLAQVEEWRVSDAESDKLYEILQDAIKEYANAIQQ
jgi:hypothetical protein